MLDANVDTVAAAFIAAGFNPERTELHPVGIQRRIKPTGRLLQAAVGIGVQFADVTRQVDWRTAGQQQLPFGRRLNQPGGGICRQTPAFTGVDHAGELAGLRWISRPYANLPTVLIVLERFPRQHQTAEGQRDLALTKARQRLHRYLQRGAFTVGQADLLFASPLQRHQPAGSQFHG
ncbi:hypothetical protein D3C73_1036450 [compost metagenome]